MAKSGHVSPLKPEDIVPAHERLLAITDPHYHNPRLVTLIELIRDPEWATVIVDHEVLKMEQPRDYLGICLLVAECFLNGKVAGIATEALKLFMRQADTRNQALIRFQVICVAMDSLCLRREFKDELPALMEILQNDLMNFVATRRSEGAKDEQILFKELASLEWFREGLIKKGLTAMGA